MYVTYLKGTEKTLGTDYTWGMYHAEMVQIILLVYFQVHRAHINSRQTTTILNLHFITTVKYFAAEDFTLCRFWPRLAACNKRRFASRPIEGPTFKQANWKTYLQSGQLLSFCLQAGQLRDRQKCEPMRAVAGKSITMEWFVVFASL